ncbi:MAG: hypothetical protein AAGI53_06300 [Planctomycetota bacterium]
MIRVVDAHDQTARSVIVWVTGVYLALVALVACPLIIAELRYRAVGAHEHVEWCECPYCEAREGVGSYLVGPAGVLVPIGGVWLVAIVVSRVASPRDGSSRSRL